MYLHSRACFSFVRKFTFDISTKSQNTPLNLMPVCVRTGYRVEHLAPTQRGLNFNKIKSTRIHQGSGVFTHIKNNSHNSSGFSYVCPVLTFIKFRSAKLGSWTYDMK